MRLRVSQLRVVLIVLNMVLPISVCVLFARYTNALDIVLVFLGLEDLEESRTGMPGPGERLGGINVKIYHDLSPFKFEENGGLRVTRNLAAQMASVSGWLQPRAEMLPLPTLQDAPPAEEAAEQVLEEGEEPVLPDGPLGEKMEYDWAILYANEPLMNLVRLRKKSPARTPNRRPTRTTTTARRISTRVSTSKFRSQTQSIVFRVWEGYDEPIKDEELGIEFYARSADSKKFVYWVEDTGPETLYSLKRMTESPYLDLGKKDGKLNPKKEEDEENGNGKAEEEKKKPFVVIPAGEHSLLEVARLRSNFLKRTNGDQDSGAGSESDSASGSTGKTSKGAEDKKTRAEQIQDLQKALNDPRVPADARRKVNEIFKGKKK